MLLEFETLVSLKEALVLIAESRCAENTECHLWERERRRGIKRGKREIGEQGKEEKGEKVWEERGDKERDLWRRRGRQG